MFITHFGTRSSHVTADVNSARRPRGTRQPLPLVAWSRAGLGLASHGINVSPSDWMSHFVIMACLPSK